jgi:transposase
MEQLQFVLDRLERIESSLTALLERQTAKEWYTTAEIAKILGKSEFTVREWCRHTRLNAQKRISGRGKYQSWVISHDELLRYHRDGLLPLNDGFSS